MNSQQVADAARVARPDLKVLFITGYTKNAAIGNGRLRPGMQVLTKPYSALLEQTARPCRSCGLSLGGLTTPELRAMKKMLFGAAALIAASFAGVPSAEAAQGCGPGFYRGYAGFCRPFYGPRFAYGYRPYYRPYYRRAFYGPGFYGPPYYRPAYFGPRPFYRPFYRPYYRPVGFYGPGFGFGVGLGW